jgi:hypothetical protein
MIDYPGQELDRLETPGVPDDIKYLGDSLATVAHWSKKVYDALRRQESPNPTIIRLDPDAALPGTAKGTIIQTTARMRGLSLVFTGGTALSVFAIRIGSANSVQWIGNVNPMVLPLPIVLDAGVDVQIVDITTPGSTNWRCYMIAYVELEDGNA